MFMRKVRSLRGESRPARRPIVLGCETLEAREVLSGSTVSVAIGVAALNLSPRYNHIHATNTIRQPVLGTIQGTVTNQVTSKSVANVKVQLINSNGDVVAATKTNRKGQYSFKVKQNGAYVVREVTPRKFVQTSPTFAYTAATGALIPGAGSSSWTYSTGNDNPAFGPVGVYAWDTVAPAGDLPFESPINITAPAIDLSPYLSVDFNNAVPKQIINNSHQIQVQFTESSADEITVGGVPFELAQFHYHDQSETTVNGHHYSLEEHFVNTSADGAETVVAVFLQLGAHNDALDPVLNAATASLTQPNSTTTISTPIDFAGLLPSSLSGWFYEGSLTTPALSQPVNWFVLSTPITLDFAQLKQYEAVASGSGFLPNARPVQPLDGRQVNEFNFDVNFQSQSVAGLNFTLAPRPSSG
jgi:carbonic anhydrase